MKKLILLLITISILFIISCKKDNKETVEPKPQGDIVIAEITKVVDQETRNIIQSIDTTNYTFTFNGSTNIIDELKVGDILVDSVSDKAPYGYLRKVSSINSQKNGETTVITEQAKLTDALTNGVIEFNTGKISMANVKSYELADGVTLANQKNSDFTVFSFDYDNVFENENGKITISGHTDLDIEFFFDFKWHTDLFNLPPEIVVDLFESGVEINQSASISCVSEAGAGINKRISLAKFYFTPWTFMIGPVPVVFVPQIELFIEMNGSITAVYTASASENFEGKLGVQYTDAHGWDKIAQKTFHTDYVAPNLTAGAKFETHVGPEVALLLYGIAGPKINVTGCAKVDATLVTATQNWNLDLIVGARSQVGVKVDLIGFGYNWNPLAFCLFSDTLLHMDNEPFGDSIYIATPIEDQSFLVGDNINITTSFSGDVPDEVEFIIDYNTVFVDTEAPFEYIWDTEGFPEHGHIIYVGAKKDGIEVSHDNVSINLVIPVWEMVDLTNQGLNSETDASDMFFINSTNGWMTVNGTGTGKLLTTLDAGVTWEETWSSSTGLQKVIMTSFGEGIFLNSQNKVMNSSDGGYNLSELTYGQFNQPTFQWKNIYDLATNQNAEIVAVGKDTGIPYHFRIYRAELGYNEPTGYFEVPYPNEYGAQPKIVMYGNNGFLYNVFNEDEPNNSYYMTTSDGGVTWQGADLGVVSNNTQLYGAHMPDEDHVWIVGEDNDGAIVIMSDNGGVSWTMIGLTGTPAFSSVYFTSDDEGFATVKEWSDDFEAKLYRTTDGGHTWEPMIDTRGKYGMSKVFFLGQDFGVMCGKGPLVFRYSLGN